MLLLWVDMLFLVGGMFLIIVASLPSEGLRGARFVKWVGRSDDIWTEREIAQKLIWTSTSLIRVQLVLLVGTCCLTAYGLVRLASGNKGFLGVSIALIGLVIGFSVWIIGLQWLRALMHQYIAAVESE